MKRFVFITLIVFGSGLFTSGKAQNSPLVQDSLDFQRQMMIYQSAIRYSDFEVAKSALYNLIAIAPGTLSLYDSLALLYFESKRFASTALLCKDILQFNPGNPLANELSAISYESLGLKERALENYESLYLQKNDIYTLYKIAFLQYDLKRYMESKTNTDIILSNKEAEELKLVFNIEDNQQQQISMKAAIFNLKGLIAQANQNKEGAEKFYRQALLLAPEFNLAKNNLKELSK